LNETAFLIAEALVPATSENIDAVTGFATLADCKGILTYTTCKLVSAVGQYSVSIQNDIAALDNPAEPQILRLSNNTATEFTINPQTGYRDSTLGDVQDLHYDMWHSFFTMWRQNGTMTGQYNSELIFDQYIINGTAECPSFSDPYPDILASFNKLMVYVGSIAAEQPPSYLESRLDPGELVNTSTTGQLVDSRPVYITNFAYFLGALLVELLCVSLIAPTYVSTSHVAVSPSETFADIDVLNQWGWWKIGRRVSFSLLELGKAFGAPALADFDPNATGKDLARALQCQNVQYGFRKVDGSAYNTLGFGDPNTIDIHARPTV
jgi:hypothetical protein